MLKRYRWFIIRLNLNSRKFKKYYSSLAENLLLKQPKSPNTFEMESVNNYYEKYNLKEKLIFTNIQSDKVFKILKNFDETKALGIDYLSGIFLKDGAKLLTTQITQLCNLSISSGTFPNAFKIAKLKPLLKKVLQRIPRTTVQSHFCHLSPKSQRELYMNKLRNFLTNTKFCMSFNRGLGKTIRPIFACLI